MTKVRNKNEVIAEAKNEGRNSAFCVNNMDLCHLKNSELEPQIPEIQRSSCTPR